MAPALPPDPAQAGLLPREGPPPSAAHRGRGPQELRLRAASASGHAGGLRVAGAGDPGGGGRGHALPRTLCWRASATRRSETMFRIRAGHPTTRRSRRTRVPWAVTTDPTRRAGPPASPAGGDRAARLLRRAGAGGGRGRPGRTPGPRSPSTGSVGTRPSGATWVTRTGIKVDRISSAWLIRRFIDPAARFKFVPAKGYQPEPGELRLRHVSGRVHPRG